MWFQVEEEERRRRRRRTATMRRRKMIGGKGVACILLLSLLSLLLILSLLLLSLLLLILLESMFLSLVSFDKGLGGLERAAALLRNARPHFGKVVVVLHLFSGCSREGVLANYR